MIIYIIKRHITISKDPYEVGEGMNSFSKSVSLAVINGTNIKAESYIRKRNGIICPSSVIPTKKGTSLRKKKNTVMDSSECQWESRELFMLPVDLGTPRYTAISLARASAATL